MAYQCLAAQQRREIGDRLDDCINLESQFLGDLDGTALNPKCPQSGRRGGDSPRLYVPMVLAAWH